MPPRGRTSITASQCSDVANVYTPAISQQCSVDQSVNRSFDGWRRRCDDYRWWRLVLLCPVSCRRGRPCSASGRRPSVL